MESATSPCAKMVCFWRKTTSFLPTPMVARKLFGSRSRPFFLNAIGDIIKDLLGECSYTPHEYATLKPRKMINLAHILGKETQRLAGPIMKPGASPNVLRMSNIEQRR